MDLREPKRKRVGSHIKPQQPFPILIESENGIPVESSLWPLYIGNFTGDCVVVYEPEEMKSLYTMGFFGKGSFSRGYPSFGSTKKGIPPVVKERQWERRKIWIGKIKNNLSKSLQPHDSLGGSSERGFESDHEKCMTNSQDKQLDNDSNEITSMDIDDSGHEHPTVNIEHEQKIIYADNGHDYYKNNDIEYDKLKNNKSEDDEIMNLNLSNNVLVLADSDDEDVEKVIRNSDPHIECEEIKTAVETLNLTLEEAFFLSYALGCLQVIDIYGKTMTIKQLWITFSKAKPDFIESYVVYHYFRAKGWVVKPGYKFGGDFLLYKQGPPFYHASYIVLMEKVDIQLSRQNNNSLSWTKLHGLNRLAESSGKDIIICQVLFPNLTPDEVLTPKCLPNYQVNEVLIKRWISSQERVEKEQTLIKA